MDREPLGYDDQNQPVYLKDIWPSSAEIAEAVARIDGEMFRSRYADVFSGDEHWQKIPVSAGDTYQWNASSSYVQNPPYFEDIGQPPAPPADVENARVLAVFGDSITTDHISPAGNIKASSPAGLYLQSLGVAPEDFNSYGSRRGNHEVMMRGTFANIRIKNEMLGGEEGGNTLYQPGGEKLSIYDAAMRYQAEGVPLVVIAGKEYGPGSSRDWAAKGGHRRELRAHPPIQPHRHGRAGAAVRRRADASVAGSERHGEVVDPRARRGHQATPAAHRRRGTAGRLARFVPGAESHRHAERGPVLQGRRHPALCIAPADRQLIRQKKRRCESVRTGVSPSTGVQSPAA